MNREEKIDKIREVIDRLYDEELIDAWNNYCFDIMSDERVIKEVDNINDDLKHLTPKELLTQCEMLNSNDTYYYYDGYDYISFNDIYDIIDEEELIQAMIDNEQSYGLFDVCELLESED